MSYGKETERFDAMNCTPAVDGRHTQCELLFRNKVQDEVRVEEVTIKDRDGGNRIRRLNNKAYTNGKMSVSFEEPVTGVVESQGSNLRVTLE